MRVPASTYRLQVSAEFTLYDAADVLPYLHDLGVDWVYLSPILRAEPGSTHGYDVVDHGVVDPARGGSEGLAALSREARRLGMGVLVDIVPNHMGVATARENPWWWDLLAHGRSSSHAEAFDVDWDAAGGRLLLPVVGDGDESSVRVDVDAGVVRYHDEVFPLAPATSRLEEQHYDLVSWRRGDGELNYRRFFSITTLAGIRVEEPRVFAESHAEIGRWFADGLVDGLRIDHPDGLRDPASYLDDLAKLTSGSYVVVEKILESGESLPAGWATAGTTGYDVLGLVDRVLVDPDGQASLTAVETRLRGSPLDWHELVHERKRAVADTTLLAEVRRLVRETSPLVEQAAPGAVVSTSSTDASPLVEEVALRPSRDPGDPDDDHPVSEEARPGAAVSTSSTDASPLVEEVALRPSRDPGDPDDDLIDAIAEVLACFPVYRSYLPEGREHLEVALAEARRRRPELAATLDALAPVLHDPESPAARRFQQTSGAVMAKGVEDSAFYRATRLTSLTEVGGDPSEWSASIAEFHAAMAVRQRDRPHAMTTTTTHDTKLSEDTRARIAVLAEVPDVWADTLDLLLRLAPIPDPSFGNLLWQSAVGVWPASRGRIHDFAEKAMREAAEHTTWTDPDASYEQAVHAAVDAAYDDETVRGVLDDLAARIAPHGATNGLSAKLLALTVPGVPDVYQGTELWDHSLVDPDNRRPVDFDQRRELLARVRGGERPVLSPHAGDDGAAKLLVTQTALTLRRDQPHRFTSYEPVVAHGPAADHVLAFDRGGAVTVATRLPVGLAGRGWADTSLRLPAGAWADLLTGREHTGDAAVRDVLADLPVALLIREEGER